jgi:hypothetical protein
MRLERGGQVGVPVADLFAGMYAAVGILAALRHAEATGQGQHLDIALLDAQATPLPTPGPTRARAARHRARERPGASRPFVARARGPLDSAAPRPRARSIAERPDGPTARRPDGPLKPLPLSSPLRRRRRRRRRRLRQVAMLSNHGAAHFASAGPGPGGAAGPSAPAGGPTAGRAGNAHRSIVPYQASIHPPDAVRLDARRRRAGLGPGRPGWTATTEGWGVGVGSRGAWQG